MEKVSALIHFHNCFFHEHLFFKKTRKHFKEYNFRNELWRKLFFRVVGSKDVLPHFRSKEFNITSFCNNVSNIVSLLILGDKTTESYWIYFIVSSFLPVSTRFLKYSMPQSNKMHVKKFGIQENFKKLISGSLYVKFRIFVV